MLRWLFIGRRRQWTDLKDKRVWIIGASSGLGAALAVGMAGDGAKVAISARSKDKLDTLRAQLQGEGHRVVPLDVTDQPSMTRAVEILRESWPTIDYVIYNAGQYEMPEWEPFQAAPQLALLDVNLGGVFRLLEAVLPWWQAQRRGHLTLVSSITALGGAPHSLAYGASKAGMSHLAESLAIDLAKYNVEVQLVSPGFMDTPMLQKIPRKLFMVIEPGKAAWYLRRRLGVKRFEIHFPRSFTVPAKFIRWVMPREWYLAITRWAGR